MTDQSIAHYKITGKLGQGGMGEVYRATDTKLDREVAIKVLPKSFAEDATRLARFEREAKVLAALNHPNIAVIYGIEQSVETQALIMELVEGETLGERLQREPMTVPEALECCKQIAEALEAAHEKGIVHRDLKPENIKITPDGRVKVLDFGLAKEVIDPASSTIQGDSPTLTHLTTLRGELLGTAPYMSPEQARARPVDKRSDIWSFGCVLYECLTGKPMFGGEDVTETLASIIKGEPDWDALPEDTAPTIHLLLRKCLNKDRKRRLRDIGDARIDIEQAIADPSSSIIRLGERALRETHAGRGMPRPLVAGLVAGVAIIVLAGGIWLARRPQGSSNPAPVTRVELAPPGQRFAFQPAPAISRDGRQIAFWAPLSDDANSAALWVRSLDSEVARMLPGTSTASTAGDPPAWSPDGQSLAFFSDDDKLKRIEVAGGTPRTLADAGNQRGCTWGDGDEIIYVPVLGEPVHRISASGGTPIPLNLAAPLDRGLSWPSFLPDGRHFLISSVQHGVFVVSTNGTEIHPVEGLYSRAEYADGYLFFGREGSLFAQPFDLGTYALTGKPFHVGENLGFSFGDNDHYAFSVSPSGTLVYSNSRAGKWAQLAWFDHEGNRLGSVGEAGECTGFALSPDEQQVVLERRDPRSNKQVLWLVDMETGAESRFSGDEVGSFGSAGSPVWSPDGKRVYYSIWPGLAAQSLEIGSVEKFFLNELCWLEDLSRDGNYAVVIKYGNNSRDSDVWIVPLEGEAEPWAYLDSPYEEGHGCLSPADGRWYAYVSDETGRDEVYVQSFPQPGRAVRVSVNGGRFPQWRSDGKEIYFIAPDGKLMAAAVDDKQSPIGFLAPTPLFPVGIVQAGGRRQFFPSADGQRFLVNALAEDKTVTTLKVVFNWKALVKGK